MKNYFKEAFSFLIRVYLATTIVWILWMIFRNNLKNIKSIYDIGFWEIKDIVAYIGVTVFCFVYQNKYWVEGK